MNQKTWDEIEYVYNSPIIDQEIISQFKKLKNSQSTHTKAEGNPRHYCAFFLPYDKESGKIYLGYHIKADDWIPPGGHIEKGETPSDAAIREMKEELKVDIGHDQLELFALTVKEIGRPEKGCIAHYDVWHLVHVKEQPFDYLKSEYHDAGWFNISAGLTKITKNPDFAQVIAARFPTNN